MPVSLKKAVDNVFTQIEEFTGKLNIFSVLGLVGVVGPLMLFFGDLISGLATKNYSIIHHSISSLALTSIGWAQTIGFLALGLTVEVFATGLLYNVKKARWFHAGIALFVLFGFAMLMVGAFHTDAVGVVRTLNGRIHGMSATTAFLMFPFAILCLMPSLKKDENWAVMYSYTGITFLLAILLIIVTKIFQEGSGWFGLIERLLVLNMILWVEVAAFRMFLLSLKRGKKPPAVAVVTTIASEDF